MKELSLHILDIVQNSIVAEATQIFVEIDENALADRLSIGIKDNGRGMTSETLARVKDPYTTSRTTRRVGMGLPLLNNACRLAGGALEIDSTLGAGTRVNAVFKLSHIDLQPLGDIAGVMVMLIAANPAIHFVYTHRRNGNEFKLDTQEVSEALDEIPLNSPQVGRMLKEMIVINLEEL